ncbi:MAG TPA: DJ-1/PfpI family protein [Thermoleophilaceae bacterium]
MKIGIVVFDGFDELDAIGPYEVFRNAGWATDLVTLEPQERVHGSHGLVIVPHAVLGEGYDLVVVPGGGWNDRGEQGAWAEAQRGDLPAALRALHERGARIASVCTGGMVLAAAGITAGRPSVTHHHAIDELRSSGAEVVDARVVDHDDLVTSGGVTSGIDMALWIVERELGPEAAAAVADEMEHDRRGEVYRPTPT